MIMRTVVALMCLSWLASCAAGPVDEQRIRDGAGTHEEDLAG